MSSHSGPHIMSLTGYLAVFLALMVGTVITVWVAYIDLGPINTVVAISIAVVKAVFVVLYFMHVRYSTRLVWVFASAGFLWLVILLALLMGDVASREWLPSPASDFLKMG